MKPKRLALSAEKEENPSTEENGWGQRCASGSSCGPSLAVGGHRYMCSSSSHFRGLFTIPAQPPASQAGLLGTKKAQSQRAR